MPFIGLTSQICITVCFKIIVKLQMKADYIKTVLKNKNIIMIDDKQTSFCTKN